MIKILDQPNNEFLDEILIALRPRQCSPEGNVLPVQRSPKHPPLFHIIEQDRLEYNANEGNSTIMFSGSWFNVDKIV